MSLVVEMTRRRRAAATPPPVLTAIDDDLPRVDLFGLSFVDAPDERHVTAHLLARLNGPVVATDELPVVVTPNVHHLVCLDRQPGGPEDELCRRARYVLPDGQPVVTAGRLLGRSMSARLAGSTLFGHLWPALCAGRSSTLVIAPSAEVGRRLEAEHPLATAVTAPWFATDDEVALERLADECVRVARTTRPEVVVVGLGNPKQERLVVRLLARWSEVGTPRPLFLCLGASLEFQVGLRRRAPGWMQRWGLEWVHRFGQEPRRLFRRYFVEDLHFVRIVWRERRRIAA